jgi:broad specificity phosphatase PhoE
MDMRSWAGFGAIGEGSCRIFMVRHGQTVMNTQVRFRGRRDVPLDAVGRREALEAARGLSAAGLVAVYSSPLGRAMEVASAIAGTSGVGVARPLDALLNLDYGEWEGLTREESAAADPAEFDRYLRDPEAAVCPGGEAVARAADRVVAALRAVAAMHPNGSVAAVSHGVMVRLAVLRVAGPSVFDWQFAMPTGSAVVFDVAGGRISLARPVDRSEPDPRKAGPVAIPPRRLEAAG